MLISAKQAYLAALIFSTVLAWASFFGIIFYTNPAGAGVLGAIVLFISLVVGFSSSILILWQLINRKKS